MSMTERAGGEPTRVLLLRDVPERRLLSMERYADELEREVAENRAVCMTSMTVHESATAARAGLGRFDSYLARFVRYPIAASRRRADVYHIVDHGYAHLAALLPRERVVVSCHDVMLLKAAEGAAGFTPGRLSLARFRWSTSFLKSVARVVAVSETTKRDVVRLRGVVPERVSVVPNGIAACFRPLPDEMRARLKADIASSRHLMLHVSTGDPYKNVPGTLRVVAALRDGGVDVTLVRAGKPLNDDERRLARGLRLDGVIVECGRVSDERLVELYNACDVLLFPSFYEGYGWPPLEAMACGTPAVTSDCPSLTEIAGDAALTVPATDVAELARAVRAVLESPDLAATLRERGIGRAERFTWQRMADAFVRVYQEVAHEAAGMPQKDGADACAA